MLVLGMHSLPKLGHLFKITYKPPHDRTNKMAAAPNKDSDQPGHCTQWVAKDPSFLHADSEDSEQIGRMPKLI